MEKAKAQVRERVGGMIEQLSAIKEEDEGSRRNTWFRLKHPCLQNHIWAAPKP